MKNKSLKKRVLFLITCLAIIAIGICLPIVGTTLASNDAKTQTTISKPTVTTQKIDRTQDRVNISDNIGGGRYWRTNNSTYYPNVEITLTNCLSRVKGYTSQIPSTLNLPYTGSLSTAYEPMICDQYNPSTGKNNGCVDSFFGIFDYSVEIVYDLCADFNYYGNNGSQTVSIADVDFQFLECAKNEIDLPYSVTVGVSNDGTNFYKMGGTLKTQKTSYGTWNSYMYSYQLNTYINARYVKAVIVQKAKRNLSVGHMGVYSYGNLGYTEKAVSQGVTFFSDAMMRGKTETEIDDLNMHFTDKKLPTYVKTNFVYNYAEINAKLQFPRLITSDLYTNLREIRSVYGGLHNLNYNIFKTTLADGTATKYAMYNPTSGYNTVALIRRGYATLLGNEISYKGQKNILVSDYVITPAEKVIYTSYIDGVEPYYLINAVTSIGNKALANLGNRNSIKIGKNINYIASDAFVGTNFAYVNIEGANPYFYVKNNTLYDKNNKVIYKGTASTGGAIAEPSKSVNELIKKAGYLVDIAGNQKLLRNIKPCTLISDFVAQFNGKQIKINGVLTTKLKGSYIKTGDKLTIDGLQFIALVWGDGNGDGKVNAADYILARRSILNMVELNTYQTRALCVTGTSKITTADYIKIRKYIMGEITL